jgi:hypothetical protein
MDAIPPATAPPWLIITLATHNQLRMWMESSAAARHLAQWVQAEAAAGTPVVILNDGAGNEFHIRCSQITAIEID